MVKLFLIFFALALILVACGDSPTPAPAAPVEVTRIVEVSKVVEVTKIVTVMVTAPAPTQSATTAAVATTIAPAKTTATSTTVAQATAVTLVVNAKRTQDMVETRKAKEGFNFIVLDISITNNSDKPLSNGLSYFQVLSDQSFAYGYSNISFNMPKGMKSTDLAKGETTRGELAFEVPTGEVIKSLRFEDGLNKITVPIP